MKSHAEIENDTGPIVNVIVVLLDGKLFFFFEIEYFNTSHNVCCNFVLVNRDRSRSRERTERRRRSKSRESSRKSRDKKKSHKKDKDDSD